MATARPLRRHRASAPARPRLEGQQFSDAAALYGIPNWGKGFFAVSEDGDLLVRPTRESSRGISLKQIVDDLVLRGISTPLVIRFPQILSAAVANLNEAFGRAIAEYGYESVFRGVFPIKVNQKRVVVEHIIEAGRRYGYGLEAGSKPELLAAISADLAPDSLITCNGYKDETFVRMALNAVRMKKKVVLILEKVSELERILTVARGRGVRPLLGMRAKLYARGSGKWAKSGGESAKFGLTTPEMLEAVKILKSKRMLDCMVMLHFHIGSQITDIRKIKDAIREAGRVYAKLRALGVPIQYLNLGGGLGVDYDGSKTAFDSSMNYSVQEYANDVVYTIQQICEEEKVPAPILVTESGRAVTAYHSVFVTNVLDVADRIEHGRRVQVHPGDPTVLQELAGISNSVNAKTLRESYHDALQYKEELFTLFNLGHLSLEDRSKGEILFWQICEKIHRDLKNLKEVPEEFEDMETMLADKYVLNFSVFQSLPDIWAIDQLFPILPIHRLNERPAEFGTLADITCDSDGKIEKFIDLRDIKETLPLHSLRNGDPYYIGVCLMGAYQDVLGDLHNLFGEAHEALVTVDGGGQGAHRERPARRVLRARARVHELRQDGDPGIDRPAAAARGRKAAEEGRDPGDLPGVRRGLSEVHLPRAIAGLVEEIAGRPGAEVRELRLPGRRDAVRGRSVAQQPEGLPVGQQRVEFRQVPVGRVEVAQRDGDLDAERDRREASRSVTVRRNPPTRSPAKRRGGRREVDRRERYAREPARAPARGRACRRRATARRSPRRACRCPGRPTGSSSRAARCRDRASPRRATACWAKGRPTRGTSGRTRGRATSRASRRPGGQRRSAALGSGSARAPRA